MISLAARIHLKTAGADRPQSNFNMSPELKPPLVDSFLTLADCPRTLSRPSALCSVGTPPVYPKLTGCTDDPRTVRYPLADHPLYIFATETSFCRASGDKSHERRTVRLLPADRPRFQNSDCPEFCQLSQIQLWIGIIAHIKVLKFQNLHKSLPKSHMSE